MGAGTGGDPEEKHICWKEENGRKTRKNRTEEEVDQTY